VVEREEKDSQTIEVTRVSIAVENQDSANARLFDPHFGRFDTHSSSDNDFDEKLWDNGN
jgi:hypothetical protein